MKRMSLITIAVTLLLGSQLAARDWEWVSGGNFSTVTVQDRGDSDPSNDAIWLAGNLLVRGVRRNGSWNWQQVLPELTDNYPVWGLVFYEAQTPDCDGACAMMQTSEGVAYSDDSGETWTVHPFPEWLGQFNRFQMVGPRSVFAAGRNTNGQAIVARSDDGGASWEVYYDSGEWQGSFTDLQIYADGTATLIGNYFSNWMGWQGIIIETTDDFENVSRREFDDQSLWRLASPTRADHYALGGPDLPGSARPLLVYRHSENGAWMRSTLPEHLEGIYDMWFDGPNHGWVVGQYRDPDWGSGAVLLETSDGAQSWSRTNFSTLASWSPDPLVELSVALFDGILKSGEDLFLFQRPLQEVYPCPAGAYCPGIVVHSTDETNWNRIDKLSGYRQRDITLDDRNGKKGLLAGFDSVWDSIIQPIRNGETQPAFFPTLPCDYPTGECPLRWLRLELVGNDLWALFSLAGSNEPPVLGKSTDGGESWETLDLGVDLSPFGTPGLSVAGPDSIWVAVKTNEDVRVLSTTDGGQTWDTVTSIVSNYGFGVAHASQEVGCFWLASISCTKDGGETWGYPWLGGRPIDVVFLNEELAWATVYSDSKLRVLRTTDGGSNWEEVAQLDFYGDTSITSLQFIDTKRGWLTAGRSTNSSNYPAVLLKTGDGGETWEEVSDGVFFFSEGPWGLIFDVSPDGNGWLASRTSGMLLKRAATSPVEAGDSNGDGKIDSGDLLEVVRILSEETASGSGADCNQDGKTDVGDLICVVRKLEQK